MSSFIEKLGRGALVCRECTEVLGKLAPLHPRLHRRRRLAALLAALDPSRLLRPTCMPAKEPPACTGEKPLLMVDIDGVISLFGFPNPALPAPRPGHIDGSFHTIDGIPHFLSRTAAAHLLILAEHFGLVWCSGWEEKAEEYLPRLLGLPAGLPFLRFERSQGAGKSINGHWKLDAIDAHAGGRPLAWIDDAFNPACHAWAQARPAPTLLVQSAPEQGLTSLQARLLEEWARERSPAGA